MSDTSTVAAPVATTLKTALLSKGKKVATDLAKVEATALEAVRAAGLSALEITLVTYATFAAWLVELAKVMGDDSIADLGGNALLEYLKGNVAADDWGSLPKGAPSYVKAVQFSKWHTAETLATFRTFLNTPDTDTYASWLQVNATGKFGNKSNWDVKASLVDPSDWDETANNGKGAAKAGAKFGTLVKKQVAGRSGSGSSEKGVTIPAPLAKLLKLDLKGLRDVKHVADLEFESDEKHLEFVLQIVADYIVANQPKAEAVDAATNGVKITMK